MEFEVVRDFFSHEFKSMYCAGMRYSIRANNHALRVAAGSWHEKGLIRYVEEPKPGAGRAFIAGTGHVSDVTVPKTLWERAKAWL